MERAKECGLVFAVEAHLGSLADTPEKAEKLAAEILLVTRDYPALFDLADEFAPFRKVMIETFCQMIENGETYLQA